MAALTRYGKIEGGEFVSAPLNLEVDGRVICNVFTRPDILGQFGYKPVRSDAMPPFEDGQSLLSEYSDEGDYIRESFTVIDGEGVD